MSEIAAAAAADAYCTSLARRHYENFVVASRLVPRAVGRDLMRIYAYCRTTDDLGDESGDQGLQRLTRWRDEVSAFFAGELAVHPVLLALRDTVTRHGLAAQPFLDLIQANVQDQTITRYESWPELLAYCRLSAAPVGRMVLGVFGYHSLRAQALSDDVCIGLQLANHAQDVRRDAVIGRSYLLESDVRASGVAGAVRALCERARELLASGRELETMVANPLRAQLALYRLGGLAIVAEIVRAGYRTDIVRPTVSGVAKAILLARALAGGLRSHKDPPRELETV